MILLQIIIVYLLLLIASKSEFKIGNRTFDILKSDKDFIKPNIKLNAEFELIKMKNGMVGLLIYDPYATFSQIHFQVEAGSFIDTISGISHLAEHMVYQGSENYPYSFPNLRKIGGIQLSWWGAITGQTDQKYFYKIPYNFKFDEALKVFADALRHPLYLEKAIKKEIQSINSEFYLNINEYYHLIDGIFRQLSSNKTSFKQFTSGNNITLNPDDSRNISRKLKAYHNIIQRPENFFFLFYSNQTIKDLEKYAEKYLSYEMYEFPENEIDKKEGEQLIKNFKNFEKFEIFDEQLYEHGIYFNSNNKKNVLIIYFFVGDVDFKNLEFDLFQYYSYLFRSESLFNILKEKNYISSIESFEVSGSILIKKNNVFSLYIDITENGLNNINDVLFIIYKYIDIMKKEGYKKKYFDNFIKFLKEQSNKDFNKEMFNIETTFSSMIESYRTYGINQILNFGTPANANYNITQLKNYLNQIKYEKSFFIINSSKKITAELKTFLDSAIIKTIDYYNKDFLYGKIPKDFKNKIFDKNLIVDNLSIRDVNIYFSEKYENDIPCYKNEINKCKELNEFDYESENKYVGNLLDEKDKYFITYYQIDKSSETFLVNSYIKLKYVENEYINSVLNYIITFYINNKLSIINEVPTISIVEFDETSISFKIKSFTDKIRLIIKDLIKLLKEELQELLFNCSKISTKEQIIEKDKDNVIFTNYIFGIGNKFISGGINLKPDSKDIINVIDSITFDAFKYVYNDIFNKIISVTFKIAGNINKNIVQELHTFLKENIEIYLPEEKNMETCEEQEDDVNSNKNSFPKDTKVSSDLSNNESNNNQKKKDFSYIIDYYQKSEMPDEYDGAILIMYRFEDKYKKYMDVLKGCLENIVKIYLRFEYCNAYHQEIYVDNNFLIIFEQGRYKEPFEMEDDINEVLLGMIQGKIKCDNYKDIIKSYSMKKEEIPEKNPTNLFNEFISATNKNEEKKHKNIKYPKNFLKFMKKLSPIFTEPERYTILVSRYQLSDDLYNEMIKKRKHTAKYILNENLRIIHTDNIEFLKPKN